jgi:hypothetical protein
MINMICEIGFFKLTCVQFGLERYKKYWRASS